MEKGSYCTVDISSIYCDNAQLGDEEGVLRCSVQEAGGKLGCGYVSNKLAIHNVQFRLTWLTTGSDAQGVQDWKYELDHSLPQ